ncbi:hypothetical protein M422DRAFT_65631 [Sphaerobolus stellatus SS14]|nr:hypothetical protein M422DRAFT_65631 [Sphaerobolus stellatus SS14]
MSRKSSSQYYIPPGAQPPAIPGSPIDKSIYPNPFQNNGYSRSTPYLSQPSYRSSPTVAMPEPFLPSSPPAYPPQYPSPAPPSRSNSRYPTQPAPAQNPESWQFPNPYVTRSASHQVSLRPPTQVHDPRPRSHSSIGTRPPPPQLELPQSNHNLTHKYSYSEDMRHLDLSNGPPTTQTIQRSPSIASTNISDDFVSPNLDAYVPENGAQSADSLDKFQRGEGEDTDWAWHTLVTKEARESLPLEEVMRQSAIFELINAERSFVKDLELVKEIFITGLRQSRKPILSPGRVEIFIRELFYNMEQVLAHHQRMLSALFALQREQHPILLSVGDIVLDNVLQLQPEYDAYIKHFPVADSVHRREQKLNDQYRIFLERCAQDPRLGKRDLVTFISRPVSRLPRLSLQLLGIKKRTEALSEKDGDVQYTGKSGKKRAEQDFPDLETIPIVVDILDRFVKSTEPGIAAAEGKVKFYALCESLRFRRGEIIDMDLYNEHRTLVYSGQVLRKERKGNWHVWAEYEAALLDNFFLMTKSDPTTGANEVKSRPIPLEFLRLGSFDGPPEQDRSGGLISAISSKNPRPLYPIVVSHASSPSRTYTLYTSKPELRSQWKAALVDALGVRRVVADSNKLFAMSTINGDVFRTKKSLIQTGEFPGRITAAVAFSSINRNFIGVATPSNGIYFDIKGRGEYRRVFSQNGVKYMAVLQAFNKLLILHNDTITAYSLDVLSRVILGQSNVNALEATAEKVSKADSKSGTILFFRVGVVSGRTLVVYASKGFMNTTLHTVEAVVDQPSNILQRIGSRGAGQAPTFRKYGESFYVPKEPFDVTLLAKTIAVSTDRLITVVDPTKLSTQTPVPIPDFSDVGNGSNPEGSPLSALKARTEYAKPLGIVRSGAEELIVIYDEFGCYVTKHALPTRKCGVVRWETRATAYAERGPHILLFSSNFIEVRDAGTGRLVQVLDGQDIRLVQSQPGLPLMIAKQGATDSKRGSVDELIELLETAPLDTPRATMEQDGSVDRMWDEWE